MKTFLISVFVLVSFASYSQVYLKVTPTPESSLGACDASIDVEYVGATPPFEITWWYDSYQMSRGLRADQLCSGKQYVVTITDSNCLKSEVIIYIHPDPTKQIYPKDFIITLPSSLGACDGYQEFHFDNTSNINYGTSDSIFSGFCESNYSGYSLIDYGGITNYQTIFPFNSYLPSPCMHFTTDIFLQEPTTANTGCDGSLLLSSDGGATNTYYYDVFITEAGGANNVNYDNDSVVNYLCEGAYIVDIANDLNNIIYRKFFFAPSVGSTVISNWNVPDSIPANIDTIQISAFSNCDINYTIGFDTLFISDIDLIGAGQYHVLIKGILNTDTTNFYHTAFLDTSQLILIQLITFCNDSTRFVAGVIENNIFYGHNLTQSINEIWEKNIVIYPNPANQTIKLNNLPSGKNNLIIYNLLGEVILNTSSNSEIYELDIRHLPEGYYLIQINNENNQAATKKFIVIHQN